MPDQPLKILFITAEAAPMVNVGGLAAFSNGLPKALRALGHDVRVMLPAYGTLDRAALKLKPYGAPFAINLGYEPQVGTIQRGTLGNVPVYYVDHAPTFSDRAAIYTDDRTDAARFAIFSTLALTVMSHLNWQPDVVHLNDWHTALMARWLHNLRAVKFSRPTLLTIHDLEHQGVAYRPDLGWAGNLIPQTADQIVNFMWEGIAHADVITTVSPRYARQIVEVDNGAGLDQALRDRADDLYGVLNGIDGDVYNPATDRSLAATYSADNLAGKAECKRALQAAAQLPERADVPLLAVVGPLSDQKGTDLLVQALPELIRQHDLQLVVLGTGDVQFHAAFAQLAAQFGDTFHFWPVADPAVAPRVYSGADAVIVPSRVEPYGPAALLAQRYGALPLVRSTGGLSDVVRDVADGEGNGLRFDQANAHDLLRGVARLIELWEQPDAWRAAQQRAMQTERSWSSAAQQYAELYSRTIERHQSVLAASF